MSATSRSKAVLHDRRVEVQQMVVAVIALTLLIIAIGSAPTVAEGIPHLTRAQVRGNLTAAAHYYHLSAADTRWIVAKGVHIAWGESRFHTHTGHKSGCYGLFQFGPGWAHHGGFAGHHHKDWRACGKCSCYRFVKVFKVGGRAKIRQHWRSTYGGVS